MSKNRMSDSNFCVKCPRCKGKLKPMKKVIETVSPEHNYETKIARQYKCVGCGQKVFVRG